MANIFKFSIVYFIIIISILSFYFNTNIDYKTKLILTNKKLAGTTYIDALNELSIDLLHLSKYKILQNTHMINEFDKKVNNKINTVFLLQKKYPNFINKEFNRSLKHIKMFKHIDDIYIFLDKVNHENYRVGDISSILFEEDREMYFLGSLLTHYMPEYIVSLTITKNTFYELKQLNKLPPDQLKQYKHHKSLFLLSIQELDEIIKLMSKETTNKKLTNTIKEIKNQIKNLIFDKNILTLNTDELNNNINIYDNITKLSHILNHTYLNLLNEKLKIRKHTIEKNIFSDTIAIVAVLILISLLFVYFYKAKQTNIKHENKIKSINKQLDKVVLYLQTDIDGKITQISTALLDLTGYKRWEVIGKTNHIFSDPDTDKKLYEDLYHTIQNKKIFTTKIKNRKKNGKAYWIKLTVEPELDEKNNIVAYHSNQTNITDIINLEKEKAKTQEALNFKSKFLSNMSHEIRTPINGIIGLTHVLSKSKLDTKQIDLIKNITSSSELLLNIVNDILDISKIEAGKMQIEHTTFDLKELIDSLLNIMKIKAVEKNINITLEYINFTTYEYIGDSLRISQVVNNFLSNAIKFTSHGSINITVTSKKKNKVLFSIKDTGIGIKDNNIKKLFQDFSQADMSTARKYGGTGLGLSISKNLVELMGGKIWVESTYGKGSTFSFEIPLKKSSSHLEKQATDNIHDLENQINKIKNMNILVAEDNKMNQLVLSMLLENTNIKLDFAQDGLIALEIFQKKDTNYDLILMDIQMPNMNGYEATIKIRELDNHIPIIALSANIMQEDIDKAFKAGMNYYLKKPIDINKLYEAILQYTYA